MTKYTSIFVLLILIGTLNSCKKNQGADAPSEELTTQPVTPPETANTDQMLQDAQSKPLTNIALSESSFNFGDIKKGTHVEHVYEVTNTGKNPLIISSVKPGCGCTAPDYTKEPILPGKSGQITLKFDSTNFDGVINKQAEVYANVEKAPVVISFTVNVVRN